MKISVWYWIEGVDPTRPGGPWWRRDFRDTAYVTAKQFVEDFIKAIEPCCKRIQTEEPTEYYHPNWPHTTVQPRNIT